MLRNSEGCVRRFTATRTRRRVLAQPLIVLGGGVWFPVRSIMYVHWPASVFRDELYYERFVCTVGQTYSEAIEIVDAYVIFYVLYDVLVVCVY